MTTLTVKLTFYAPFCHSLKDKRMITKSMIAKIRNKFNASACEAKHQDVHQTIVIGVAVISESAAHAQNMLEGIVRFAQSNTEAEITDVSFEA